MSNRIANPDQQLPEYVIGYITDPRETFSCELKPWIDPAANDYDQVKIAKACMALRNNNGGVLVIGISDAGEILELPNDYDPDALFTQDTVQTIVSAHSAQQFGIDVHHVMLAEPEDGRVVAIVIPSGITAPTMCKKDSRADRDPKVKNGIIYTRTVESNGTISSGPASQQGLEDIVKRCFDNRVADIGQFLRDHLTDENIRVLNDATEAQDEERSTTLQNEAIEFADSSAEAFTEYLHTVEGD